MVRPSFAHAIVCAVCWLFLAIGPVEASAQTINGTLLDGATDEPIDLGLIIMMGVSGDSIDATLTNDAGRFSITAPDSGSYLLIGSAYGYHESVTGVYELGAGGVLDLEYRLAPAPFEMDEILVELGASRVLPAKVVSSGFVRRLQRGLGHFLTPYQIEHSPERRTSDLLDRVPGVMINSPNTESYARAALMLQGPIGRCYPRIYLDGILVQQNDNIDGLVPIHEIEAVEIYRRPAEVPIEYGMGTRAGEEDQFNPCGVVLFWTKA